MIVAGKQSPGVRKTRRTNPRVHDGREESDRGDERRRGEEVQQGGGSGGPDG